MRLIISFFRWLGGQFRALLIDKEFEAKLTAAPAGGLTARRVSFGEDLWAAKAEREKFEFGAVRPMTAYNLRKCRGEKVSEAEYWSAAAAEAIEMGEAASAFKPVIMMDWKPGETILIQDNPMVEKRWRI